jgi:hypothetical protein
MAEDPLPTDDPACPLCAAGMHWRDVSPCMECGGDPRELKMLDDAAHSYHEVLVFGRFPIVLCDFCQIDFGTYPSYFFGLPRQQHLGFNDLHYSGTVQPTLGQDWVCTSCGYRMAFSKFVQALRKHYGSGPD